MSQKKIDRVLLALLTLLYVLLFALPYNNVLYSVDDPTKEQNWTTAYIIDDELLLISYISLFMVLLIYILVERKLVKVIAKFISIGLSFFLFFISTYSVVMPIQDYNAGWGVIVSLFIFPIVLAYFVTAQFVNKLNV